MTRVAVLGTGIMGAGMAGSAARAGLDVTVWNRSADKAEATGLPVAATPADAVTGADVVVTMLFDAESVAAVMADALPSMGEEAIWLQTATVGLAGTAELAALATEHGVPFVDAPVLGTRKPAENGQLTVLAAGPETLRPRLAPVLDAIGARTVWAGAEPGAGHKLKLVANAWVLSVVAGTGQSVGLAEALGLDPARFFELIEGGPLDSGYGRIKAAAMRSGDFTPSFALSGATKDAGLIRAAAEEAGVATDLVAAMEKLFGSAGDQDDDMAAVIRAFRAR